jgi:hypothetical protein
MRPPAWFRITRAGSFALVCVGLSQAGHDLMASRAVPLWSVVVALVLMAAAGYRLADRKRSTGWILAAVQAAQLYLHVWFTWTTPAQSLPAPGGLAHGEHLAAGVQHASTAIAHGGMSLPGMLAAHAVAGTLVALWLSAGERALWRALTTLARVVSARFGWILPLLPTGQTSDFPARHHETGGDERMPVQQALRHAVVRRGPPWGAQIRITCA